MTNQSRTKVCALTFTSLEIAEMQEYGGKGNEREEVAEWNVTFLAGFMQGHKHLHQHGNTQS